MADVAEPDREASNSAAVDSLERPNDENGENNTAKEQCEGARALLLMQFAQASCAIMILNSFTHMLT